MKVYVTKDDIKDVTDIFTSYLDPLTYDKTERYQNIFLYKDNVLVGMLPCGDFDFEDFEIRETCIGYLHLHYKGIIIAFDTYEVE